MAVETTDKHRDPPLPLQAQQRLVAIAGMPAATAYSLSSGGPIIAPDVDSFVITPISAHSLNSRPLVVSNKSSIEIKFSNYNQDIIFITDGQLHEILRPNDVALISNSNFQIGLIDFDDTDYFNTLRIKMGLRTAAPAHSASNPPMNGTPIPQPPIT